MRTMTEDEKDALWDLGLVVGLGAILWSWLKR